MNVLAHDSECTKQNTDCLTSGCSEYCDYQKDAIRECVAEDKHFRQVATSGACYNCGGKS